jgi:hypothetical protein
MGLILKSVERREGNVSCLYTLIWDASDRRPPSIAEDRTVFMPVSCYAERMMCSNGRPRYLELRRPP